MAKGAQIDKVSKNFHSLKVKIKVFAQIDKVSKNFCKLTQKGKIFNKKIHKKYLRKIAKDIENPNPQSNRYSGFIG